MATLVGLAFTSPAIAVMVIDRTRFRVHFYQNKPSELHAFLQEADDRLPVVLLESVNDLQRVQAVEGIHAFLLSDDPRVLADIQGAIVLDAEPDDKFSGFKKIMIRPDTLNAALLRTETFVLPVDPSAPMSALRDEISFRELLQSVVADRDMDKDFLSNICLYLVGALPKRTWVSRVQKPGLAAGIPVERMAELEKYIETAPSAEMLWRAYYDHAESGVPLHSAALQFEADAKDLDYLISQIGAKKGLKYSRDPRDKPLVMQKKRKVRKLKRLVPQGSSMNPSGTSVKTMEKQMTKTAVPKVFPTSSFDLEAVLGRIDQAMGGTDFSRTACGYLCGLVDEERFSASRKLAVKNGAEKSDLVAVSQYAKRDTEAASIWKAYCYYSYYVGVTPAEAADKFETPVAQLQTVLKYKPMAFVFEYVKWPEELA